MSLQKDLLEALSLFASDAMTASELFDVCKGEADIKNISTALSVMFKEGMVNRKSVNLGGTIRYGYWKKEDNVGQQENKQDVPTFIKTLKTEPIVLTEPAPKSEVAEVKEPTKEELIVMWMNGAEIEQRNDDGRYFYADIPQWREPDFEFRLKPQFYEVEACIGTPNFNAVIVVDDHPNVKFKFNREGDLIGAEFLA